MIYYLNIPTLGHRVPAEERKREHSVVIRAEVFCEEPLFRISSDMIGVANNDLAEITKQRIGLQEIHDVFYLQFEGGPIKQDFNILYNMVFRISSFLSDEKIGLFKGHLFCSDVVKHAFSSFISKNLFIPVPKNDLSTFLWDGGHLSDVPPTIRKILLEGLRRNWNDVS